MKYISCLLLVMICGCSTPHNKKSVRPFSLGDSDHLRYMSRSAIP